MRFAIIGGGVVSNVVIATPEIAADRGWVTCPASVSAGWAYDGQTFTAPAETPEPVPPVISNFQFRRQIRALGRVAAFRNYLNGLSDEEQEKWLFAPNIHRASPLVANAMAALSITANQMDNFFRDAGKIGVEGI